MDNDLTLDDLWEALLSEEAPRIRKAWLALTDDEAGAVLEHLRRMTTEPDWADLQRQAAGAALAAIASLSE
ncbi:MAG: hypothetical protein KA764_02625 [Anaerolineales bacterium]|nr:hypothetical protein [Anaerolineales bacterium]